MKCPAKVKDIYAFIDSIAPFCKQCEWDNSGLLVGDPEKEVKKIGVVLDLTNEAVSAAKELGIDLIISHHPVIFRPCKTFCSGNPAFELAQSGISAICAHTSLDCAKGGVNDALAAALRFRNATAMSEDGEEEMIRICETAETTAQELAKLVAEKLTASVAVTDGGKKIRKVALCGGAGGSFLHSVAANGCEAYITGEAKHHEYLEAKDLGLTLISAGHFETENPVVPVVANRLKENFDCEVVVIPQSSPVKYY
ncbi:MAG: Nif3-like dinuclear metal center hexameric protein [Clostridia bacterium]|nr:Nif3-like dinuclear metal center hexameric protein [Clostridia bacterium]